jgi:CDP-glucose 4,6-dehydratase
VVVTSDKCYATSSGAHIETDSLGGEDPYSASKAAAEIVVHSYRGSFFSDHRISIATARAGNIIGGGDWSAHRIIPDCTRAIQQSKAIELRQPGAVRPWQHVLDAVSGYIRLADALLKRPEHSEGSWNFGPPPKSAASVKEFVDLFISSWRSRSGVPIPEPVLNSRSTLREREFLILDSTKAKRELGWDQLLDLNQTADWAAEWYLSAPRGDDSKALPITTQQIDLFLGLQRRYQIASGLSNQSTSSQVEN